MTITLPNDLRLLTLARVFIEAACRKRGLASTTIHDIVLAVTEAVSNVIRHAHGNRPETKLTLECRFAADAIELRLRDEGAPFDVTAVPELDPGELRVGGRGVYLMRALMDELSCEHPAGGGNILRMMKRLPDPAGNHAAH